MPYVIIFLLYITKHAYVSNVWDIGYSDARDRRVRRWWVPMAKQTAMDAALSIPFYMVFNVTLAPIGLVLEMAVLVLSCLLERLGGIRAMLLMHVVAEMCVIFSYAVLTVSLVSKTA